MSSQKETSSFLLFKSLFLLLLLIPKNNECHALVVGRRRIQSTTPLGGKEDIDALLDPRPNIPVLLGYVGCQAVLPSLGQCPLEFQIQPPWFTGSGGGGICPPEFYNFAAIVPGLLLLISSIALYQNISANRLLITSRGLGIVEAQRNIQSAPEDILFEDIEDWNMTPVGLFVQHSSKSSFFPLFWDSKSVEALLEDRI